MIHALSLDIEEYFQVHAFNGVIDSTRWDEYPSRVAIGTQVILDLLAAAQSRATFFVLGWVARRQPALVRSIVAAGHELASHGYNHRRVDAQTAEEFRLDIRAAKETLENIAGIPVTAYRAPSFSITAKSPWAHQVLVEEGHTLDSSMAAGRGARSLSTTDGSPFTIQTQSGPLTEVPLPTMKIAGRRVPVGGGGYFRLFPEFVTQRALRASDQAGVPFCVYLHPWEFDPDQPRIMASAITTFRHRVGIDRTAGRLERLLKSFPFDGLSEVANHFFARPSNDGSGPDVIRMHPRHSTAQSIHSA